MGATCFECRRIHRGPRTSYAEGSVDHTFSKRRGISIAQHCQGLMFRMGRANQVPLSADLEAPVLLCTGVEVVGQIVQQAVSRLD